MLENNEGTVPSQNGNSVKHKDINLYDNDGHIVGQEPITDRSSETPTVTEPQKPIVETAFANYFLSKGFKETNKQEKQSSFTSSEWVIVHKFTEGPYQNLIIYKNSVKDIKFNGAITFEQLDIILKAVGYGN